MADLDLAHIRALAGAATDGPWELVGLDDGAGGKLWGAANDVYYNPLNHPEDAPAVAIYVETGSKEDAEFIAAARELVPAMADEIERLRLRVTELEGSEHPLYAVQQIVPDGWVGMPDFRGAWYALSQAERERDKANGRPHNPEAPYVIYRMTRVTDGSGDAVRAQ